MGLRAGMLTKRLLIQQTTQTQNALGEPIDSWGTYATRWAAISYEDGRESLTAGAERTERIATIRLRYLDGVTEKMRGLLGATVYDFLSVANVGEKGEETIIRAAVRG